jgi:hypothetical protein
MWMGILGVGLLTVTVLSSVTGAGVYVIVTSMAPCVIVVVAMTWMREKWSAYVVASKPRRLVTRDVR